MPDLKEQNEWLDDILALCGIDPNSPEQLLELLYEDFAISASTFLQPAFLAPLLAAGYLDAGLYALCRTIAERTDYLTQHPAATPAIRQDARWQEIFRLCAEARAHKALLNLPLA